MRHFGEHVNPGFLEYRKSITEAGDYAAVEWTGRGSTITDVLGRNYIDCLGGYGIYSAGICNPMVIAAVPASSDKMPLCSQELLDPLRAALGDLLGRSPPAICVLLLHQQRHRIGRGRDEGGQAAHGAQSLHRRPSRLPWQDPGRPLADGEAALPRSLPAAAGIGHPCPFGDAAAVERACAEAEAAGRPIAGVVFEPVQGEAGAVVPPDDFWPAVRQICDRYGALLIADEVQTGMGRTGKLFGVEHWDVVPDIMPLAKALGGGVMPAGAIVMRPHVWEPFTENPFLHTTTFGGNPLACAAAIAAIHVTLEEDLPGQAAAKEAYLLPKLRGLARRYDDIIVEARGKGLLLAPGVPRRRSRLPGGGRIVPARRAGRRHAYQCPDRAYRAGPDHQLRGDRYGAGRARGRAQGGARSRGRALLTRALN